MLPEAVDAGLFDEDSFVQLRPFAKLFATLRRIPLVDGLSNITSVVKRSLA